MKGIPRGVWILGLVSMFMDVSSEMIHALLPIFVTGTLGASMLLLGAIEGVAEATAQVSKLFSGFLSDHWRSRKGMALAGYGLAALVKPLFPLADGIASVAFARFADRVGKGIRGAPRDALVADLTPPALRGAAFGLRQSLDTVGAFLGPLIAIVLMVYFLEDLRAVLWIACIPALAAVLLLAAGVSEPPPAASPGPRVGFGLVALRSLGAPFWRVTALGALIMLARFSEAFLVLKAAESGLAATYLPLVLVVMSIIYSLASYPAGVLSDRIGRGGLLVAGLLALIGADLTLAWGQSLAAVVVGVGLWGLHMGLSQGLLAALVANATPPHLRATGFGAFNMIGGIAAFFASLIAGILWDMAGPFYVFMSGATICATALAALAWIVPRQDSHGKG